jgi:four helix bundle protein
LPNTTSAQVIEKQLLRSGTSVGAHYREARRAKSNPDFISLMQGGLKELDETAYWMELLQEVLPCSFEKWGGWDSNPHAGVASKRF